MTHNCGVRKESGRSNNTILKQVENFVIWLFIFMELSKKAGRKIIFNININFELINIKILFEIEIRMILSENVFTEVHNW
jgi:hypothetical protein